MKIYASIVTFHTNHADLKRLIDCVMASSIDKLYIIDNSSNDELREFVQGQERIHYIHSLNLGYGSGHNVAMKKSIEDGAEYHIILNPDVYWKQDIVGELSKYMHSNEGCGLVMPKVLYPSGETQYLCKLIPTPLNLLVRRFIPIKKWRDKLDYNYEMQWCGYDKIMEVPILSGCFMMIRCSVLKKTKGFDERFFMYAEDVDLCRRIGEVSQTIFYPKVSIYHEYAKGSYHNGKLMRIHIKSLIKYFNKWGWLFDKKRRMRNRSCISKAKSQSR